MVWEVLVHLVTTTTTTTTTTTSKAPTLLKAIGLISPRRIAEEEEEEGIPPHIPPPTGEDSNIPFLACKGHPHPPETTTPGTPHKQCHHRLSCRPRPRLRRTEFRRRTIALILVLHICNSYSISSKWQLWQLLQQGHTYSNNNKCSNSKCIQHYNRCRDFWHSHHLRPHPPQHTPTPTLTDTACPTRTDTACPLPYCQGLSRAHQHNRTRGLLVQAPHQMQVQDGVLSLLIRSSEICNARLDGRCSERVGLNLMAIVL
mmetsp:Transcript_12084/g.19510  ORF Transcript_12084/g.19510 Transcript_12084/m.19510 type:complete len:258 (-) Transcript_12084:236-1009(-)